MQKNRNSKLKYFYLHINEKILSQKRLLIIHFKKVNYI